MADELVGITGNILGKQRTVLVLQLNAADGNVIER